MAFCFQIVLTYSEKIFTQTVKGQNIFWHRLVPEDFSDIIHYLEQLEFTLEKMGFRNLETYKKSFQSFLSVNIAHYNLPIKYLNDLIVDQIMSVNYWLRRYKDKAGRSSSIFTLIQ